MIAMFESSLQIIAIEADVQRQSIFTAKLHLSGHSDADIRAC